MTRNIEQDTCLIAFWQRFEQVTNYISSCWWWVMKYEVSNRNISRTETWMIMRIIFMSSFYGVFDERKLLYVTTETLFIHSTLFCDIGPRLNWLSTQFYLQTSYEVILISTTWFCFNIIPLRTLYINSSYLKLKMSFNNVCNKYGCHRWSKLGNIPAFIQNRKIENKCFRDKMVGVCNKRVCVYTYHTKYRKW